MMKTQFIIISHKYCAAVAEGGGGDLDFLSANPVPSFSLHLNF